MGETRLNPLSDKRILALASIAGAVLFPFSAQAQQIMSKSAPVLLEAASLDYQKETQFVIAEGNVQVTQGETILVADTLVYDQRNNILFADGNVSVLEPTGNVYFADQLELRDDMKTGVVTEFRARLADNSLFVAREGVRVSEDVTELKEAVYSPCSIRCDDGSAREPLWQVRARDVKIDNAEQEVVYHDAYMDLWGQPVLYTPYFSHATPGADNRSGLLAPEFKRDANLGTVVKAPLYLALGPDKDATITPMYASLESPVAIGEYRQLFDNGSMKLAGSITRPKDRDAAGNESSGSTTRGHFFGQGAFAIDPDWNWGFDVRRTTDDTYLRRYDFNNDPLLTSRVYTENFNYAGESGRNYVIAQALAFQGVQRQDDRKRSPLVVPVDMYYETMPLAWNSRLSFSGGAMTLTRDVGPSMQRLSMKSEWAVPYVTDSGQIFELSTSLRADGYNIDDQPFGASQFDGTDTRVIPEAQLSWRYPLINRFEDSSLLIEPVANLIVSPDSGNSNRIPNEDSATPEFTDINLFSENRFAGYDRVETGPRINYGVRGFYQMAEGDSLNAMIGQAYRVNDDPLFPISNDLTSRFSDYVGMFGVSVAPFDLRYRFRFDKDDFDPKRSEVMGTAAFGYVGLGINYLDISRDAVVADKRDLSGSFSIKLTDYWTLTTGAHRDMLRDSFTNTTAGLIYRDECLTLLTTLGRDYTSDRDLKSSTSVTVQVLLRNIN